MKSSDNQKLIETLKTRFEKNMPRHKGIAWSSVQERLERNVKALKTLQAMEESGGEPDVIGSEKSGQIIFCDCSAESPASRRSLCYDKKALDSRKENKPKGSAVETAREMGIDLMTEEQYRELQQLGEFDRKTSSWIETPSDVRSLGGALFCDRRYDKVFTYHNGAESYYAARGFRGLLRVRAAQRSRIVQALAERIRLDRFGCESQRWSAVGFPQREPSLKQIHRSNSAA